jgi:hypothetical protein
MPDLFLQRIEACSTLEELRSLYTKNPTLQVKYGNHFTKRKKEITPAATNQQTTKISINGTGNHE